MIKATITSKGQLAIPEIIRDRLNLKPGTEVLMDIKGETVILRRSTQEYSDWRTMQGMITTGPSLTKALEREHAEELERDDARIKSR